MRETEWLDHSVAIARLDLLILVLAAILILDVGLGMVAELRK